MKLMLGLRTPKIAEALIAYGFSDAALQEGWTLLRKVTRTRLDSVPVPQNLDPTTLKLLDDWENHWFPIASVVLQRHFPNVHERVFRNLSQAEGAAVIITVSTFLERLDKIPQPESDGGMGAEGQQARELLENRGLKAVVVDEARGMLQRLGAVEAAEPRVEEDYAAAEDAMWSWYLEWSTIVRTAIKDRRLLRQLGFLQPAGKGSGGGGGGAGGSGEAGDDEENEGEAKEGGEGAPKAPPTDQ
jgi:hypothetical protein